MRGRNQRSGCPHTLKFQQEMDEEMEMDSFRNKKTGKKVFVEDISEDFPVTFLMGELSVLEFSIIASELTPEIQLLEVDSSWEGKPTTIVVAMTEEQVRNMFGTLAPSVYILLNTDPQSTPLKRQQVTFKVTVLNQQNPQLQTTLTLTITGPNGYSFYDFQPINVTANDVFEYSFNWVVPNVAGTYVVSTGLAPATLTAYDAKWLEVG
jgi:hypothetical protein